MAAGSRALLDAVPDGGRGLAISHTPLVERAVLGLTGREIEPLGECEGILVDPGTTTARSRSRSSGSTRRPSTG